MMKTIILHLFFSAEVNNFLKIDENQNEEGEDGLLSESRVSSRSSYFDTPLLLTELHP